MAECNNCGSFVTEDYLRVFAPEEADGVQACPRCEDMVRNGSSVREARAKRF